ncbi:MAG: oligosaccharide flippase family protein [Candidatus Eisenbacteria bacterium]
MSGSLTRKVGVIGASRLVASSVTALLVSMYLSRAFDRATYGTFQQTWFFTQMAVEIALLGFPIGILYIVPRLTEPERRGLLVRVVLLLAGVGAALAALLYGGAPFVSRLFGNPELGKTLRIFSLYALFVVPGIPMDAFLIAQNRHRLLGLLTVAHSVLLVAAVLLPARAGLALSGILWALVGYGAIRAGLVLAGAASTVRGVPAVHREGLLRRFVLYSLPVALNDLLRVVAKWLDKNIVSAYFSPEVFAVYANGAVEIPFVGVLAGSIASVVIPEFSRLSDEGRREDLLALWHRAILKAGAILIPLFAFLMVLAVPFLVFLFSEKYRASAGPFRIYLLLLPLRSATYTPILLALGRSRLVALGALADVAANLVLSILLIPRFSYLGPAVATVVTTHAQVAFYLVCTARILSVSWRRVFPWKGVARLLLLSLLPALLLVPLARAPLRPFVVLAIGTVLYFAPIALLIWRFGPLGEGDKELVRRILGRGRR